ncbi:MAG: sodium-dependent transporter [Acidobacteriota bacterium]|nr:MAG: sodium-dependent transporter [Acidobacteriota bacterium]
MSAAQTTRRSREVWGTRIGVILAAAGNAIGIGNLLRFPGQAAQNGGGAFMIPYVLSLLLFGLPMMWIAWTVGRMGGRWHHGTTPGIFDRLAGGRPVGRYLGVIGVALPLTFVLYYAYIEAWCLGYAWFSFTGVYADPAIDLNTFYQEFVGNAVTSDYFSGLGTALVFLLITIGVNIFVLYRGVTRGIELLAKIAIPLLLLFCVFLSFRVLTLGERAGTVWDGLNFLWTPDFSALNHPTVWMAAAGQVFFTLSIGFGSLECYGSYLESDDDIALTGLTTASVNEFVEVIFGSMIAIPAAAVYYGADKVEQIASQGTYTIGMVSMPTILRDVGGIEIFGTMWFLLLFFAAFTSSVAVAQPVMSFLQDEAGLSRASATGALLMLWLLGSFAVVFFYKFGALVEMDFWAGTIGLVVFAAIEVVLFAWIFGIDKGWDELHHGAHIRIPRLFKLTMKWVTPPLLIAVLVGFYLGAPSQLLDPLPSIHAGVLDRGGVAGGFSFEGPRNAPERQESAALENEIRTAVTATGRDLRAWVRVTVHPAAPPSLSQASGDPDLLTTVGVQKLFRWVQLQHLTYEPPPGRAARSVDVLLAVEGRYRRLAIWITRLAMFAFTIGFGLMIWAIWRGRREETEHPPLMAAGGA